jgi:hypothetical protein
MRKGIVWLLAAMVFAFNTGIPNIHYQDEGLAAALLRGELYLNNTGKNFFDTAVYKGKAYWPLGIYPSVLMMPLVWTRLAVSPQNILKMAVAGLTGLLIYLTARVRGISKSDSFWWMVTICLGSVYLSVALMPSSWYLAQVIVVGWWWLAILEYFTRQRWQLIGFWMGGIMLTRMTAGLGLIYWLGKTKRWRTLLLIPVICAGIYGGYNYLRFGRIWEQGYAYQLMPPQLLADYNAGLFNLRHIPNNSYYLLLAGPKFLREWPFVKADPMGMSVWISSPWLIYLFLVKWRREDGWLWAAAGIILVPIIGFFGTGWVQWGYRYALDFLPLVWMWLMGKMKERYPAGLPAGFKILSAAAIVTNMFLFLTWRP